MAARIITFNEGICNLNPAFSLSAGSSLSIFAANIPIRRKRGTRSMMNGDTQLLSFFIILIFDRPKKYVIKILRKSIRRSSFFLRPTVFFRCLTINSLYWLVGRLLLPVCRNRWVSIILNTTFKA